MKIHLIKFIKYSTTILIFYNIFSLVVLFASNYSIKSSFWKLTPYDYKQIMGFPINYEKLSLRNSTNRNQINNLLNKNLNRNILNVEFWNYKLILNNYSKEKNADLEKAFINLFFLTKNNKDKNFDLKKYFIKNYNYFSQENVKKILDNY
tara:strand:+ start:1574 stop:2023 length:450 start_codon:yes stop_codon:yes gene_type:complete